MKYIYDRLFKIFNPNTSKLKRKVVNNTYWLFLDQFVRLFLGFITLIIVARYFGPEGFGTLNYAIAFVSLFSVLSTLGIEKILVREIISNEKSVSELLSVAFYIKLLGGCILIAIVTILSLLIDRSNSVANLLAILFATISIFQSFDVIEYWYQAQMESKYAVLAKIVPFVISCTSTL